MSILKRTISTVFFAVLVISGIQDGRRMYREHQRTKDYIECMKMPSLGLHIWDHNACVRRMDYLFPEIK